MKRGYYVQLLDMPSQLEILYLMVGGAGGSGGGRFGVVSGVFVWAYERVSNVFGWI